MPTTHHRNLLHLLRRQIIVVACILLCQQSFAQGFLNFGNYDNRPYYFGITLAYNNSFYKLQHSAKFLQYDSVMVVEPIHSSGFSLGLMGNLALNNRFDIRLNPTFIFAEKDLHYVFSQDSSVQNKNIESILLSVPFQVKFKSDRINNYRMYLMAGVKMDYDVAANVHAREADDLIKLSPFDFGYEAGFGFEFYLPYFIFSPEIKISNGARDIHVREPGKIYSNVIGRLLSRMVVISIHLEG